MKLDICHRINVLEDRGGGGYYAEVLDSARMTRIHTTDTYPTFTEAGDAAREWDRRHRDADQTEMV